MPLVVFAANVVLSQERKYDLSEKTNRGNYSIGWKPGVPG